LTVLLLVVAGAVSRPAHAGPPTAWWIQGNAQTDPKKNFLGTTDDVPLELRVNNERALRLEAVSVPVPFGWFGANVTLSGPNVIGGISANRVASGTPAATICGGGLTLRNLDNGAEETNPNSVSDYGGTVGGGIGNRAGNDNADFSDAGLATVAGGQGNVAAGWVATVGGGGNNEARTWGSTVAGGEDNRATGPDSAIPGGQKNTAGGGHSFAAGYHATVRDEDHGTFVWSDSSDTTSFFTSTGRNQFLIRADGGVGINTNTPSVALDVYGGGRFSHQLDVGSLFSIGSLELGGSIPLCLGPSNRVSYCSSSLRYKTGIESFKGGMDIIERLDPIAFTWRDGGAKDVGLAAEAVAQIEPRLVTRNDKGEVEGVKYDRIAVILINAIREQQAEIDRQRQMIGALLERLDHHRSAETVHP
jgi:hypothetical protein